jgi:drug/metabolite transporter (DMT)-like permease
MIPPSDAALIYAMESPFSALFGFLFRGEMLTSGGLLGCGLILAGMLTTALGGEKAAPAATTAEEPYLVVEGAADK